MEVALDRDLNRWTKIETELEKPRVNTNNGLVRMQHGAFSPLDP